MKTKISIIQVNYRPSKVMKCGNCKNHKWIGCDSHCNYLDEEVYCECVCDKWEDKDE